MTLDVERLARAIERSRAVPLGRVTSLASEIPGIRQEQAQAIAREYERLGTDQPTAHANTGPASAVERLALLDRAAEMLRLRPTGSTGALDGRIPWFTHSGVSHGENRPDCAVCTWLREYERLGQRADGSDADTGPASAGTGSVDVEPSAGVPTLVTPPDLGDVELRPGRAPDTSPRAR